LLFFAICCSESFQVFQLRPSVQFHSLSENKLNRALIQLGVQRDWVGIGVHMDGVVSLAADGSLWRWWDRAGPYYQGNSDQPMLASSRRPAKIENILELESNH